MFEKLKSVLPSDHVFLLLVIVLLGVGSFGLGRLSVTTSTEPVATQPRVVITPGATLGQQGDAVISAVPASVPPAPAQLVIASRSGTKYHLPTCPGAKQIKPENRIEFASPTAAAAAGYTPAANCPGVY